MENSLFDKYDYSKFKLIPLSYPNQIDDFVCDDEDLTDFFQNDAFSYQKENITSTHICMYEGKVVGAIALTSDSIKAKVMRSKLKIEIKSYPALKIARLATHENYGGIGIGSFLIISAIQKAFEISKESAVRFIIADAKKDAIGFYEKCGFKSIKEREQKGRIYPTYYLDLGPFI